MRKLLLTLGAMLTSLTMSAQLVFVDAKGNELADGATVTMDKAEANDWDEIEVKLSGISIKNTSASDQTFNMDAAVKTMPCGSFACCFGSTCMNADTPKTLNLKGLSIKAGETTAITNTEWVIEDATKYGTCEVELKLSTGRTLTVNFVYADPAANVGSLTPDNKVTGEYDLSGKFARTDKKGVRIIRYAKGKAKKVVKF